MNEQKPLFSCLCVTENRPAFMPWLLWNYDRQTWSQRELVIVDSSPQSFTSDRPDVRVISAPPGTNVATKRNIALRTAQGEFITWFDDDDWQHPEKLALLAQALHDEKIVYAGARHGWFVDLATGHCARHRGTAHQPLFNSAGFRREAVRSLRFPEKLQKATDTRWLQLLRRRHPGRVALLDREDLFFWLCHDDNLSNPARKRRFPQGLDVLKVIIGDTWGDTQVRLTALRELVMGNDTPVTVGKQQTTNNRSPKVADQAAPSVTACLLSWKRPQNLQPIVNSLRCHSFINEILVWNNNPEEDLHLQGARVINAAQNEMCYGRFLCAQKASNDILYFQDDDVIVKNVPTLFDAFCADGNRIVHALSRQHYAQRERSFYGTGHVALLGWGSFARKEWLAPLQQYVSDHGTSFLFKREADKFYTLLLGRRHRTIPAQLRHLPGGPAHGVALYKDVRHKQYKALAVSRALAALRQSQAVASPVPWHVVVVCHNYGRFLEEAVHSVLQNDADYVVTIVDDASTDNTQAIARQLSDAYDHVSYLRHEKNVGVSRARNSGIAAKDSIFVVTLDADDKIGPNYLYEAEKLLYSGCDVANPDAILFGQRQVRWSVPAQTTLTMLLQRNSVHCAAAFRRSCWEQVGGIDETMDHWWDYDFWIRLAETGARIRRVPGNHFFYRKHGASKSTQSAKMRKQLRMVIHRKHQSLYQANHSRQINPSHS